MTACKKGLQAATAEIEEVLARISSRAGERDLHREHPYQEVRELAEAGFGKLRVPTEYGGHGVDLRTLFELLARAGQADSNIPQIWRGHFTTTELLLNESNPAIRDHWFSRISEGSVFGNGQSELGEPNTRIDGDESTGRRVNGMKFYSTGSRFADYIRVAVHGDSGTQFVIVDAHHDGVEHVDDWDGIGQRLTGSGTTIFTEVPVHPMGDIARHVPNRLGLDSFVQIVHLANLVGISRSIVNETIHVVRHRSRTSLHSLTDSATQDSEVLGVIGRLEVNRVIAEQLLSHAVAGLEHAQNTGDEDDFVKAYLQTSTAQVGIIDSVIQAASDAFNAGGSSTTRESVHLDRHWRNARTLASHNPVVYKPRVIGNHLVNGVKPATPYIPTKEKQ